MYARFFGLKQEPFSLAPDPRYLFMSRRHREALAHLLYGLGGGGGFVLLSGEIGAGKTTVCRCFLEQIPKRCNVAYIFNPKLTVIELLKTVCDEFHIPYRSPRSGEATVKTFLDPLNDFLLKTHAVGQNNVLIIDEAQMLSVDVLEQLRLLTNLETNERKLLQIILIGQPELRTMLARPELEQLSQRVIARFHLKALSSAETGQYIRHRLSVAGLTRSVPFDRKALLRVHQIARGVPRRINLLCDRAMLGAYAGGKPRIDSAMVDKAAREVFGRSERPAAARAMPARTAALALGLAMLVGGALYAAVSFVLTSGSARAGAGPVASAGAANGASSAASANAAIAGTASIAPTRPRAALGAAPGGSAGGRATTSASSAVVPTSSTGAGSAASLPVAASANGITLAGVDLDHLFKAPAHDERAALRELVGAWGVAVKPSDGDPCLAALRQQVRCFRSNSSLATVRKLDRPAVVALREGSGKPVYALLVGLDHQNATLRVADESRHIDLTSLGRLWHGDFTTLWRTPLGYTGPIKLGDAGPVVDLIASQLALLAGEPAPTGPQKMTDALRARVLGFQTAQGIRAGGIAGPTTFMQINRAAGVDEPRLTLDPAAR